MMLLGISKLFMGLGLTIISFLSFVKSQSTQHSTKNGYTRHYTNLFEEEQ
jgi:hypothetical protein